MDNKIDRNEILELLWTISNISHAEYHFLEILSINNNKILEDHKIYCNQLRNIRRNLQDILVNLIPSSNALWCTLKHLLLVQMHLLELFEKTNNIVYLKEGGNIIILIDDLLSNDSFLDFKKCQRCDEK